MGPSLSRKVYKGARSQDACPCQGPHWLIGQVRYRSTCSSRDRFGRGLGWCPQSSAPHCCRESWRYNLDVSLGLLGTLRLLSAGEPFLSRTGGSFRAFPTVICSPCADGTKIHSSSLKPNDHLMPATAAIKEQIRETLVRRHASRGVTARIFAAADAETSEFSF